jgi:hypothetical protein
LAKKIRKGPEAPNAVPARRRTSIAAGIERRARWWVLGLVALGTLRIAATYTVFNHTIDEPAHIACGVEWLDQGEYRYEAQHPPLARVAAAVGPYLAGRRITAQALNASGAMEAPSMYQQGALVLYWGGGYDRTLALARLGILPFYWLACAVVYLWSSRYLGKVVGVAAVFLFSFLPPVLAHAGLATTDMALTAGVSAAFYAALLWAEKPTARRTVLFGAATGIAVLSKLSAMLFLPAALAAALAWYVAARRPGAAGLAHSAKERALPFLGAVVAGMVVIWAGYRFSIGSVGGLELPAPELFAGIGEVLKHNAEGHPAYLLGKRSTHGWWYYYPVVLLVKTPLPFLALLVIGIATAARRASRVDAGLWPAIAFSTAILLPALFSNVNIGVRHILPVYAGLSIVAAAGAVRLAERAASAPWARWAVALLLVWHGAGSALAHPDYIPYFNALAGSQPEKVLVDSDLDWGQDMKRLGQRLRELRARQVFFDPPVVAYLEAAHGFPPIQPLNLEAPSPGWNAASVSVMLAGRFGLREEDRNLKLWPDSVPPTERLGKTTYLWYFPPPR